MGVIWIMMILSSWSSNKQNLIPTLLKSLEFENTINTTCRGVFSHPRVTKFRGWHPWKGDNSKFKISKIYRFWQTDSLHRGNWPCWVQIWHYFWARPTPSLSFWLFLSKTWKKSEKLVGQIVSQIRPWCNKKFKWP